MIVIEAHRGKTPPCYNCRLAHLLVKLYFFFLCFNETENPALRQIKTRL